MAWEVPLPPADFTPPPICACCLAFAPRTLCVRAEPRRELWLGCCDACAQHAARAGTHRIAVGIAATLSAVALAAGLPIVLPWQSLVVVIACTLGVGAFVLTLGAVLTRTPRGHAGLDRFVEARGALLVCASREYAAQLTQPGAAPPGRRRTLSLERALEWGLLLGCAFALAPTSYLFHHPKLRVLNLTEEPFELLVDGRALGRVEPSSRESAFAGLELRVPAGRRLLEGAYADARPLLSSSGELRAGRHHLFAPQHGQVCFWLETVGYGREGARPEHTKLASLEEFWVLPDGLRGLFTESPVSGDDLRASGGKTRVLRQGSCDAPP